MVEINYNQLSIISLRGLKNKKSPLYSQTMNWVKSMEEERDGENGNDFCKWIETNLDNKLPFDTYVLVQNQDLVLGTASIVPDDQCVGKQLNITGIWLGGVNIHRNYRGKGLGNVLVDFVDQNMKKLVEADKKSYVLNLFSRNPIAILMYKKRGFRKLENLVVNHAGHENEVYSKGYEK